MDVGGAMKYVCPFSPLVQVQKKDEKEKDKKKKKC